MSSENQNLINAEVASAPKGSHNKYRCYAFVVLAGCVFLSIIAWSFSANKVCIEHEGASWCYGDCIPQEAGELYCPDAEERPFLIYDMDKYESAVCNDGTQPRIHFREALPGPHETEWIFRFEGGNACFNEESCTSRLEDESELFFLTAASAKILLNDPIGGMLNGSPEKNPDWHDYNAVDLHYCSSDGWMGNADASTNDFTWEGWPSESAPGSGWHFQGSQNIIGAYEKALHDFGMGNATRVLITGFSAGCMGVLATSDISMDWFKANLPDAEVFFFCDSGWFLYSFEEWGDMGCTDALHCPLSEQYEYAWDLWKPIVPEGCLEAGFTGPQCMVPEFNQEFAQAREVTFVQENTYDIMQTEIHVEGTFTFGDSDVPDEYRVELAQAVSDSLHQNAYSFTSSNCDNHDSVNRDWWYQIEYEGEKVSYYLKEFMDHGTQFAIVDPIVDENGDIGVKMNPTCPQIDQTPHYHGEELP